MLKFPDNFLWGSATSSYQVEGENIHADWWDWEKRVGKENSARACNHYELYEQDFDLVKNLNHNAHRLSIEWSRVEPHEGQFDQKEIQHYVDVLVALRKRNIEPVVTLHHFTNPLWIAQRGGWTNRKTIQSFIRFSDVMVRALSKHVRYWITINEPTIYSSHAHLFGNWPPQSKSFWETKAVYDHFVSAHIKCYRLINRVYEELKLEKPLISISQHISAVTPCENNFRNRVAAALRDHFFNFDFINKAVRAKTLDYIGLNYYSRQLVDVKSWRIGNLFMETCNQNHDPVTKNSLKWDIYPRGLYQILIKLKKYSIPVIITENGICTSDDNQRWEFIRDHLKAIHQAISEGVNVQGYLYWSLMDNFEWAEGYAPRFGLIDVDYKTFQRTVRESARKFAEVCRRNTLVD